MTEKNGSSFHKDLRELLDKFVHRVYDATKGFPKDELFGVTSQLRRAALSVVLNYIEEYARNGEAMFKHFLDISFGSLKESDYLIQFSFERKFMDEKSYNELKDIADKIGAMLWGTIRNLKSRN